MHQADYADSTASTATSGGKFDKVSAKRLAYLTPFPIRELHDPSDALGIALEKIETLLICISEMVEDAAAEIDRCGSAAAWPKERYRHLGSIASIAQDEVSRSMTFHSAMDTVIAAHIDRRAA